MDKIVKYEHSNETYRAVHIFLWCCLLCCTMVLTFESEDEILKCDHSNESYWAILSCGSVYYAVQGGSHFWVCLTIQVKATEQYFPVVIFIMLYKAFPTFASIDKIQVQQWICSIFEDERETYSTRNTYSCGVCLSWKVGKSLRCLLCTLKPHWNYRKVKQNNK